MDPLTRHLFMKFEMSFLQSYPNQENLVNIWIQKRDSNQWGQSVMNPCDFHLPKLSFSHIILWLTHTWSGNILNYPLDTSCSPASTLLYSIGILSKDLQIHVHLNPWEIKNIFFLYYIKIYNNFIENKSLFGHVIKKVICCF